MTRVADALRAVGARMQQAIDGSQRPRDIDADDLVEVHLALADELDSPVRGGAKGAGLTQVRELRRSRKDLGAV